LSFKGMPLFALSGHFAGAPQCRAKGSKPVNRLKFDPRALRIQAERHRENPWDQEPRGVAMTATAP
jgi:hypothetical protein